MQELLFYTAGLVLVAILQVWLDYRARPKPEPPDVWLHLEKRNNGGAPIIVDQLGRRLRGVRHMQYRASLDHVDCIVLDVLAHDGQSYFTQGRRIGGRKP